MFAVASLLAPNPSKGASRKADKMFHTAALHFPPGAPAKGQSAD
jgi:hypothetical protein